MSPKLAPTQAAVAGERRAAAPAVASALAARADRVGANYGIPGSAVLSILAEYGRVEEPQAPRPPVRDTASMAAGKIGTIVLHLSAIEALTRLLEPETAEGASAALQSTKEAVTRWREVQNEETSYVEVP